MNSKLFTLKAGAPEKAVITGLGLVNLTTAPDHILVTIYLNGCPYLELTEKGEKHPMLMPTPPSRMVAFKPEPAAKPIVKEKADAKPPVKKGTKRDAKK